MPHKLYIANKRGTENELSKGMNTEVSLDGIPLKGVKSVKYEVEARGMAKVTIEMYALVDIEAQVELNSSELPESDDLRLVRIQTDAETQLAANPDLARLGALVKPRSVIPDSE